jgi:hypothetical protein
VRAGQGEVREEALQQWLRRDHVYLVVVAYRQEYLVALHSRLIGYLLPRLHEGLGHQNINWELDVTHMVVLTSYFLCQLGYFF